MIVRPKRSVTYFFVPLIDVLILLFCIFLLMPFVSTSGETEPDAKNKVAEPELPKDVKELQSELAKARAEIARIKSEKMPLSQRLSVKVLTVNSDGVLYYFGPEGGEVRVDTPEKAETLITEHERASGTKEPYFLILYPKGVALPSQKQEKDHALWFKDVQHKIDRPF